MKVLIVNSHDRGGAAKACLRLHEGLLANGVESKVLLRNKQKDIPKVEVIYKEKKIQLLYQRIKSKIKRILKKTKILKNYKPNDFISKRQAGLEIFSYPFSKYDITKSPLYKEADIINLHWVANFLDYKSFFEKNTKPVVWTLHDMNPFTGGEHYSENSIDIDEKGFPVKRQFTSLEISEFKKVLDFKEEVFQNVNNLHIVSLCNWMTNEIKKSTIFNKFPVTLIPNGINQNVFIPTDKIYARDFFGLPKNKKIILFVADSVNNKRKGFTFLKKALEKIERDDLLLCAIGNNFNQTTSSLNSIFELGSIQDEKTMSLAYSAADVFIIPSLMDNLPNTVLESLMCGTPVIGFPVGGILDMVQDGENGYITDEISVDSLVETINKFLNNPDFFNVSRIRKNALEKYTQNIQSHKYIKLFKEILEN